MSRKYRVVHAGKTLVTIRSYSPHAALKACIGKYPITLTLKNVEVKLKTGWSKVVS